MEPVRAPWQAEPVMGFGVAMTETAGKHWYIARDGKQTGPISDVEITTIAGLGYFREQDLVWRPGLAEWVPAFSQFPPRPAAPPPPAPLPQPAPAPAASPMPSPRPAAFAPRELAAPREQTQPTAGRPRAPEALQAAPQPARTIPLTTPATVRTGAPRPGAGPGPVAETAGVKPDPRLRADPTREPTVRTTPTRPAAPPPGHVDPEARPRKSRTGAFVAILLVLALAGGGGWLMTHPDLQKRAAAFVASLSAPASAPATSSDAPLLAAAEPTSAEIAAIDDRLQHTAHWPVLKRVFPEWYGDRLREAARLKTERRSDDDINKSLAEQIVALRRQNVSQALSASAPKLKALASAFLENLKQLKSQSTTACYNFISRGETTPGVVNLLEVTDAPPPFLQLQVAAIFNAIDEGRTAPVTHERPQKPDFDLLMGQLAKLGWTQADVATFADPDKLARAEPDRVCQMVQDWFVAHIAIPDPGVQERLLSETLRPVVAG